ncbi:phage head closure protein [Cupriavidus malaysiensis]|uniref:Head-tail adaptor protein n=1 Tax=Cupriavidus malaysiensis TaxID=367825 RepID=A0ABM6F5J6_9BURK|nr:phage head closure protein [Cupriavidus malaysiensis]AOZ06770.1 head-tail adaptor protein [Cupriavidus malaysiensis]
MKAGPLNKRVTIQRLGEEQDRTGNPIPVWTDVGRPVWASILHQSGRETIKSDASTSIVRASIRVRYRADVDASMRVLHGAKIYAIKAVLPDEVRREYIDLVCETGGSNG